jgi:hypothetical protein
VRYKTRHNSITKYVSSLDRNSVSGPIIYLIIELSSQKFICLIHRSLFINLHYLYTYLYTLHLPLVAYYYFVHQESSLSDRRGPTATMNNSISAAASLSLVTNNDGGNLASAGNPQVSTTSPALHGLPTELLLKIMSHLDSCTTNSDGMRRKTDLSRYFSLFSTIFIFL